MVKNKVKQVLESRNKTAYWLSKESGLSHNSILKIVNDKIVSINFESINRLCLALDCKLEDILEYIPNSIIGEESTK